MLDRRRNRFQHALPIGQHIVIVESKHAIAFGREEAITTCVTLEMLGLKMLSAINFNNKMRSMTYEISDIRTDRCLPPKTRAIQAMRSQSKPDDSFGICRLSSQRLRP